MPPIRYSDRTSYLHAILPPPPQGNDSLLREEDYNTAGRPSTTATSSNNNLLGGSVDRHSEIATTNDHCRTTRSPPAHHTVHTTTRGPIHTVLHRTQPLGGGPQTTRRAPCSPLPAQAEDEGRAAEDEGDPVARRSHAFKTRTSRRRFVLPDS